MPARRGDGERRHHSLGAFSATQRKTSASLRINCRICHICIRRGALLLLLLRNIIHPKHGRFTPLASLHRRQAVIQLRDGSLSGNELDSVTNNGIIRISWLAASHGIAAVVIVW